MNEEAQKDYNSMQELIKKREEAYKINSENNFNFDDILVNTYKDSLHFIFELIQNAEDAEAENIYIDINEDYILFNHDSKSDFSIADINSITGIGSSTKKNSLNKIGKFGIGFKSVFTVTNSPYIFSGTFKILINNYYVPSIVDVNDEYYKIAEEFKGTTIILPFKHKILLKEECLRISLNSLENLKGTSILFLINIKRIQWKYGNESHIIKKIIFEEDIKNSFKKISITKDEEESCYFYFSRELSFNDNFSCALSYKVDKVQDGFFNIIPCKNTKLSVFLPTEFLTDLNFYVHGPFRTTPSRENIPENDEENIKIAQELCELYNDSVLYLNEKKYVNESFLDMLPLNEERQNCNFIYRLFFDESTRIIEEEKVIPTISGQNDYLSVCALPYNNSILDFLKEDELQILFGKKQWISSKFSYYSNSNIYSFIKNKCRILEIKASDIINKLNPGYLKEFTNEKLSELYSFIIENERNLKDIKTMPLIKCNDGNFRAAYIKNNENHYVRNIYTPGIDMDDRSIVNIELLKYKGTIELINKLNIKQAEKTDNVKLMLNNFSDKGKFKSLEEYGFYFKSFIESYSKLNELDKKHIEKSAALIKFYVPIEITYKDIMWWKDVEYESIDKVYLKTKALYGLFEGNKEIKFVDIAFLNEFELKNEAYEFLRKAGIKSELQKIRVRGLSNEEVMQFTKNIKIKGKNKFEENYDIDGLTYVLENITKEKSLILWNYLLDFEKEEFYGTFTWHYCGMPNNVRIQCYFLKNLINNKWLYDENGEVYYPHELFEEQLSHEYERNEVLRNVLKIKKLKNGMTYEEYNKLVKLNNMDEEAQKHFLNDEYEGELIEVDAENFHADLEDSVSDVNLDEEKYEDYEEYLDEKSRIGLWGERFVFNSLINMYEKKGNSIILKEEKDCEIIDLQGNKIKISLMDRDGICMEGYDIRITINDEISEYVEVKSKSKTSSKPFCVSNSQWKLATKLFGENCGEKYTLCFVLNAGTQEARIIRKNNPVKKWIEGEVRFGGVKIRCGE